MPANKSAIHFQGKGREGNKNLPKSTTTVGSRSNPNANAYKEHDSGYETASTPRFNARKDTKPDRGASTTTARSGDGGSSYYHVEEMSSPASGAKSQLPKHRWSDEEMMPVGEDGLMDSLSALMPHERKSAQPGSQPQVTPSKKGTPVKERLQAWGSGTKDWFTSKKSQKEFKSVYNMAVLEDREGKSPAPPIPQHWIKFTLPLSEDERAEFISLSNELKYTWDEAHEYAVALRGYICSVAPPHKGYERQKVHDDLPYRKVERYHD